LPLWARLHGSRGFAVDEQGHEPAATNVAGFRVGHRQRKGGCHCRVHGVAAFLQNVSGYLCAILIGRGHRTTFQRYRISRRTAQDCGPERQGLKQDNTHDTSLVLFLLITQ